MLLTPKKNRVPQKWSVHKIITGFIQNINSWCTTGGVVYSQEGLCQPPAPLLPRAPRLWTPRTGGNPRAAGSRQTWGVTAPASPALPGLESRSFWSPPGRPPETLILPTRSLVHWLRLKWLSLYHGPPEELQDNFQTTKFLFFPCGESPPPRDKGNFQLSRPLSALSSCIFSQGGGGLSKRCWVAERRMSPQHPSAKPGEVWLSLKDAGSDKGRLGCLFLWAGVVFLWWNNAGEPQGPVSTALQSGLVLKLASEAGWKWWGELSVLWVVTWLTLPRG